MASVPSRNASPIAMLNTPARTPITTYTWPRSVEQMPLNINNLGNRTGCDGPLFPFGYGLTTTDPSPEILECK